MAGKTLNQIAVLIGGQVVGDGAVVINGVSGIKEARQGEITFLANPKYLPMLSQTQASAVIASPDVSSPRLPIIRVDNPSLAFTKVVSFFLPEGLTHPKGIHPGAVVDKKAKLGRRVSIGAGTVVEEGASIGDNTVIYPNCYIGRCAQIGNDSLIYANVSVRERVVIGSRAIIHSGVVIGSDGFGFVTVSGVHHKIPQSGTVCIGDDVEIGANTTIDRARFDRTIIGDGTKIDNLVQIAHNVIIGKNCLIAAQAGISGSTVVGDNVTIAGQVGTVGHISIGRGAILAAQAGVTKSVPEDTMVSGYPAQPHDSAKRVNACVQNLPRLYEAMKELKKKIEALEAFSKNG